jgi:hypothetical protein
MIPRAKMASAPTNCREMNRLALPASASGGNQNERRLSPSQATHAFQPSPSAMSTPVASQGLNRTASAMIGRNA